MKLKKTNLAGDMITESTNILSPTYFSFFSARFGPIVLLVIVPTLIIYIFSEDRDLVLLLCVVITCIIAISFLCLSEYLRLRKNIYLSKVILERDTLRIDEITFQAEHVDLVSSVRLRNALDKYYIYLVEIKTTDGGKFYFLDKPMNWKFESPTIRLLKKHQLLSSKTSDVQIEKDGFASLLE
ncbi:hypothetical protein [Sphingobacterium faecale]|uniref:DUF304 domain-containing protein n=1 Tax=Sphingobacterium faecale TaxID=2803775 RepID=A0ABS1R0Q4_9SPHI|nr:hypothetical protein [Sphingobacterium faecale]MBL1408283.1 hypothetical protein [Sphingobacterium faecale]